MKKVFVTGGSGLLGANIMQTAPKEWILYGNYHKNKVIFHKRKCKMIKLDLTKNNQLKKIQAINPDLIIHCAAFVNVDECEKNQNKAYLDNVVATENVLKTCEKIGCFLIHISTDSVFDGVKGNYAEDDTVNPVNVYGKTKLEAEKIVQKSDAEACIVRTNIYGWNKQQKQSLAEWMIAVLEKHQYLHAFYDVSFTPILVNNLSRALFEIYNKKIHGILHVCGSESCTKYQFALELADVFHFGKSLIIKSSVDELNLPAKRGKNLNLNSNKAQHLLRTRLLTVREGLQEMKQLKECGYVDELRRV